MFDDIADATIQNKAQGIERFGCDRQSFFYPVKGVGGDTLLIDQMVLRDILCDECPVEWFVRNQVNHLY